MIENIKSEIWLALRDKFNVIYEQISNHFIVNAEKGTFISPKKKTINFMIHVITDDKKHGIVANDDLSIIVPLIYKEIHWFFTYQSKFVFVAKKETDLIDIYSCDGELIIEDAKEFVVAAKRTLPSWGDDDMLIPLGRSEIDEFMVTKTVDINKCHQPDIKPKYDDIEDNIIFYRGQDMHKIQDAIQYASWMYRTGHPSSGKMNVQMLLTPDMLITDNLVPKYRLQHWSNPVIFNDMLFR